MPLLALACGHCGIPRDLEKIESGAWGSLRWFRRLCGTEEVSEALGGLSCDDLSVVFLVGPNPADRADLVEQAVAAGVHPFRNRFLEASHLLEGADEIFLHLRAAAQRAGATSWPDAALARTSMAFQGHMPRRALFDPRARFLEPLPSVDSGGCLSGRGCDLCATACPADAIARGRPPRIDPNRCTSCGACVPACPTSAVSHPLMDYVPLEREAEALADPSADLLVGCPTSLRGLGERRKWTRHGVRFLEVPSLAFLRPAEVLRLRAKGFRRVVGLTDGGCCTRGEDPFAVVGTLLEGLGRPGEVIRWDPASGPLPPPPPTASFFPAARSLPDLAAALRPQGGAPITLPGRGAGDLAVEASKCTMCALCAHACPSHALREENLEGGTVRLTFDAASCDACALCVRVCPERCLEVRKSLVQSGPVAVLAEDRWVPCVSCGKRVAPSALVDRVRGLVPGATGLDRCPDCKLKGLVAPSARA